jgi:hypothetical protein
MLCSCFSQGLARPVERRADRIRRNDKSLTFVEIYDFYCDVVEILDALKNNTVVKEITFNTETLRPENQEAQVKMFEVMQCNKSVASLNILLDRQNQVFAVMATSGWSSIQELVLRDPFCFMSLREAEDVSNFILQSENLRTLSLCAVGVETTTIMEALSRTKVQSLKISFYSPFSLQNGGRQLATALERCACITELRLEIRSYNDQVDFFQILLLESIPKMMGLKKLELDINSRCDQQFYDMVGHCIGGHQGEIEELRLILRCSSVNISVVGLASALRRLKVVRFYSYEGLSSHTICELSGIVADCDTLEEFGYSLLLNEFLDGISADNFKAICQLCSRFPNLKRVTQDPTCTRQLDLRGETQFVAFLEMVKRSKTIEQVPVFRFRTVEEKAAIKHHCRNNMIHNQIERIRKKGLLAATVPSSAWPLILKEFSDMPDVLYYLLQQKHGAMIGLHDMIASGNKTLISVYYG